MSLFSGGGGGLPSGGGVPNDALPIPHDTQLDTVIDPGSRPQYTNPPDAPRGREGSPPNSNGTPNEGSFSASNHLQSNTDIDSDSRLVTPDPVDPLDPPAGVCGPDSEETIAMGSSHYGVLANRQKFIGLEAYKEGIEYDSFTFNIVQGPVHGQFIGTAPNLAYIPQAGYTGPDSFSYEAKYGCTTIQRTITLTVASTYDLPIGIPAPDFGINESHHMYAAATFNFVGAGGVQPYRNAGNGPYTHYVNYQTGNDTDNPYGTAANPRKTIPWETELPAGSVVEIHGNGFDNVGGILIRGNGTASQPIFIRGANALTKPVFRRAIKVESDYTICENLEWDCRDFGTTSTEGVWLRFQERRTPTLRMFHHLAARHILMRDCPPNGDMRCAAIQADVSHVAGAPNTPTDLTQHVVLYDIEVRNFGMWNDFSDSTDYVGCTFGANNRYGWLLDSHLHHIHGDATIMIRTDALSNQAPARDIYLGRNYLHHCKENGIDVKNCVNAVISQNVMHTFQLSDSSQGDAVTIHNGSATNAWPYSDNIWVLFNKIYDAENGITHKNQSGLLPPLANSRAYVIGNVLFDIRAIRGDPLTNGVAIVNGPRSQSHILNNTIFNSDQGIWLGLLSALPEPNLCVSSVRNNTIANLSERFKALTGGDGQHIWMTPWTIAPFTYIDHNLHWEDVGAVRINITGPGGQDGSHSTIASLIAATGFGAASLVANPQFVNVNALDFHVQPGSPVLGAGVADSTIANYPGIFGASINFHFDGTAAPTPPDIGPLGNSVIVPNARLDGRDVQAFLACYVGGGAGCLCWDLSDSGTLDSADVGLLAATMLGDQPFAVADYHTLNRNGQLVVNILDNDLDPHGPGATAALETMPVHGVLNLDPDGTATYTPNGNYGGPDSFTYRAVNAYGVSAPGTVHLTVY
jgi:Big-like domain-containing protein